MKSTIERTYSLGQYQNIKVQSEIESDGDEYLFQIARANQILDLDLIYLDYVKLQKDQEHLDFKDRVQFLENLKEELSERLTDYLANKDQGEK